MLAFRDKEVWFIFVATKKCVSASGTEEKQWRLRVLEDRRPCRIGRAFG